MKKLAAKKLTLVACSAAFALAACGETTDASEDAIADSVEVPADDSMADAPDPVADEDAMTDEEIEAQMQANEATAEQAGDAAQATVDDALSAAQAAQETMEDAAE